MRSLKLRKRFNKDMKETKYSRRQSITKSYYEKAENPIMLNIKYFTTNNLSIAI